MALDKLVDSVQLDADLTSVADEIRSKGGTASSLAFPDDFIVAIRNISTGIDPSDATATEADVLDGKTAYTGAGKITGTIVTKTDSGNTTLNASTTSKSFAAGYYPNAHGCVVSVYEGSVS